MGSSFAKFLNRHTNFFLKLILSQGLKRSKISPAAKESYSRPFKDKSAREAPIVFAGQILGATDFLKSIEDNVHKIDQLPTLVLWPTADIAFSDRHRKGIEKMFSNNKSVSLERCGHLFTEDAPEETLSKIETWLRDTF